MLLPEPDPKDREVLKRTTPGKSSKPTTWLACLRQLMTGLWNASIVWSNNILPCISPDHGHGPRHGVACRVSAHFAPERLQNHADIATASYDMAALVGGWGNRLSSILPSRSPVLCFHLYACRHQVYNSVPGLPTFHGARILLWPSEVATNLAGRFCPLHQLIYESCALCAEV